MKCDNFCGCEQDVKKYWIKRGTVTMLVQLCLHCLKDQRRNGWLSREYK